MKEETSAAAQALVTSIGEHSILHFGKENLSNLLVEYSPASETATIYLALRQHTDEASEEIYWKYATELVPLYAEDVVLDIRFFKPDAPVFTGAGLESASKTYAMA